MSQTSNNRLAAGVSSPQEPVLQQQVGFPTLDRLRQALRQCDSFERFCAEVQPCFTDLVRSGHVERALRHDLERLARLPVEESARDFLFDDAVGCLQLAIGLLEVPPTFEGSSGHQLVGVVTGRVVLKCFRHTEGREPSILDRGCELQALSDVQLARGEVFAAEAWSHVVEPYGDALILFLRSAPVYPTQWVYDRETLRPIALVPGSRALDRVQHTLNLLSHIGSAEDAEVCFRLARHPAHAIRWQAVKTACALEHPDAVALLKNAVDDVHPEIREAASQALRQWN